MDQHKGLQQASDGFAIDVRHAGPCKVPFYCTHIQCTRGVAHVFRSLLVKAMLLLTCAFPGFSRPFAVCLP
jgi:hypothetical protein